MHKYSALIALLTSTACGSSQGPQTTDSAAESTEATPTKAKSAYKTVSADGEHECSGKKAKENKQADHQLSKVSVPELAQLLADKKAVAIDVNNRDTRNDKGVIPGAILLTGYNDFNVDELPADKAQKLVFYCANEHCSASKHAAKTARAAGYENLSVLPAGIFGWVKAGETVSKAPTQEI